MPNPDILLIIITICCLNTMHSNGDTHTHTHTYAQKSSSDYSTVFKNTTIKSVSMP